MVIEIIQSQGREGKVLNHYCRFSGFIFQLGLGLGLEIKLGQTPANQFTETKNV